ncbi:MAG: LPS assembly lipoprotein LptE [Nitrospirota bacterium]
MRDRRDTSERRGKPGAPKTLATRGYVAAPAFWAFLAFLAAAVFAACGYQFRVEGAGPTIGGSAGVEPTKDAPRLAVRMLENKSFEPNLEIKLTDYVRHEFSVGSGARVVSDSESADLVLTGQIIGVSLPTLSFSQTTTLESRAEVIVAVKIEEVRTKKTVWTQTAKASSEFFVTPDLQFNRVLQNRALEQAGRLIAEDLASRFLLHLESNVTAVDGSAAPVSDESPAKSR